MSDPTMAALDQHGTNAAVLAALVTDRTVAALEPRQFADHGLLVIRPDNMTAEVLDVTDFEDRPRFIAHTQKLADVASLIAYVNRHRTESTMAYMRDATGIGVSSLAAPSPDIVTFVLDDHPSVGTDLPIGRRQHTATLTLKPTPAARRWAAALDGKPLDQRRMVELIVDGVGEIADPPAAELRDLISDLQAVRSTEAKSVVHLNGEVSVELAENVTLHAGTGNLVKVPEKLTLVLQPWTAVEAEIAVEVSIRPVVDNTRVLFRLDAPHLEEALNRILVTVHAGLGDTEAGTGISPLWIP